MRDARRFRFVAPALAALFLVALPMSGGAQGNPMTGTWVLNLAKSKYDPGPAPKSNTVTYTETKEGIKASARGVGADGNPTAIDWDAKFDGKEVPVKGSPDFDGMVISRLDANTFHGSRHKGGKEVQTAHYVVSKDGKTLTMAVAGTNAAGKKISNTLVYDKQ